MCFETSRPVVIAHRGASYYEPENTVKAIVKAIELGADAVEVDVRACRDGIPVVIHDPHLKRLAGIDKYVKDLTLQELRVLRVFGKEPIPTFEEVLGVVRGKIPLVVEIKEHGIEEEVVKLLENYRVVDNVVVVSFHSDILSRVKELNESLRVGLITSKYPMPLHTLREIRACALFPRIDLVSAEYIDLLHRHGFKVYPWVINDPYVACHILDLEANGFATDRPDIKHYLKFMGRL